MLPSLAIPTPHPHHTRAHSSVIPAPTAPSLPRSAAAISPRTAPNPQTTPNARPQPAPPSSYPRPLSPSYPRPPLRHTRAHRSVIAALRRGNLAESSTQPPNHLQRPPAARPAPVIPAPTSPSYPRPPLRHTRALPRSLPLARTGVSRRVQHPTPKTTPNARPQPAPPPPYLRPPLRHTRALPRVSRRDQHPTPKPPPTPAHNPPLPRHTHAHLSVIPALCRGYLAESSTNAVLRDGVPWQPPAAA